MDIEIRMGKIKSQSRVFVDGVEQRGILDFSLDAGSASRPPSVTLKVWAESAHITCPSVYLIDTPLRHHSLRPPFRQRLYWWLVWLWNGRPRGWAHWPGR